jgi:hypothetical protein
MSPRLLRDNAFLVAAVLLPALVVGFFLLATAVPQWTVGPPDYDAVLRGVRPWDANRPRIAFDVAVRDGRVEITARALEPNGYSQWPVMFLFDHRTLKTREIPLNLPDHLSPGDPPQTIVVDVARGRTIRAQAEAPDGYTLQSGQYRNPGLLGDVFGMRSYDARVSLVNGGRRIPVTLPPPFEQQTSVTFVGWVLKGGGH